MTAKSKNKHLLLVDKIYAQPTFKKIYDELSKEEKKAVDKHVLNLTEKVSKIKSNLWQNIINDGKVDKMIKEADDAMFILNPEGLSGLLEDE
jgi:hypothetical protein